MKVLLVDDEQPARNRMRRLLEAFADVEIVGEAANGAEAIKMVGSYTPDVVFLDIEMPVLNGIEVAAVISVHTFVVFVTAYDRYAIQAFDQQALDYLVKPVEQDRLTETIRRLRTRLSHAPVPLTVPLAERMKKLGLRSGTNILALPIADISAIVACSEYTEVLCGNDRHLVDDTLTVLEGRLPPSFMRVHRSSLINLDFLKELMRKGDRKYVARLADYFETEVAVSRENLSKLQQRLGLHT